MTTREKTADHIGEDNEKVAGHIGDATTMIDHAELKRLAEAATPGPWHAVGGYLTVRDPDSGSFSSTIYHLDEMGQKSPSLPYQAVPFAKPSDAAFIAAANPATVLSLLSEIAALRGEVERWKRLKGYAQDQVSVERQAYRSLLADHNGADR